jgi:hypothetical protein
MTQIITIQMTIAMQYQYTTYRMNINTFWNF